MARPIRIEVEGAVYHVTARGNERRRTFRDDEDRLLFLQTIEECVLGHGLRVHGFCLMPNHYHLLVETPRGNLSRALGWLQTAYTIRFNRRHRRCGHLFQGRFKAHLVEADAYAMVLLRYIHLNPVRPRAKTAPIPPESRAVLHDYRWSSHRAYQGRAAAPRWLSLDWLSFFGHTRAGARREYERFIGDAFEAGVERPWEALRQGLVLGSEAFVERIRDMVRAKPGVEEIAWVARTENGDGCRADARILAAQQPERRWRAWVLARLGGERNIDIAHELGYRDGSAITHLLNRLENQASKDPVFARRQASLRTQFESSPSSVDSAEKHPLFRKSKK